MKKIITAFVITAAFVLSFVISCTPAAKDADVNEVFEKLQATGYLSAMVPVSTRDMFDIYGIETDKLAQGAYYLSENSSLNADEVAIFEVSDPEYADTLLNILKSRIEKQIQTAERYSAEEATKLKKTTVYKVGNYVYFVVCNEYDELMKIMKENIG